MCIFLAHLNKGEILGRNTNVSSWMSWRCICCYFFLITHDCPSSVCVSHFCWRQCLQTSSIHTLTHLIFSSNDAEWESQFLRSVNLLPKIIIIFFGFTVSISWLSSIWHFLFPYRKRRKQLMVIWRGFLWKILNLIRFYYVEKKTCIACRSTLSGCVRR